MFSPVKLKRLGLLWCNGGDLEKTVELYDILQDNDQKSIACSDKDFKVNFFALLDIATEMVMKQESLYIDNADSEGSNKNIQQVKEEQYDDVQEEFLDVIFDTESILQRKNWQDRFMTTECGWIFHP